MKSLLNFKTNSFNMAFEIYEQSLVTTNMKGRDGKGMKSESIPANMTDRKLRIPWYEVNEKSNWNSKNICINQPLDVKAEAVSEAFRCGKKDPFRPTTNIEGWEKACLLLAALGMRAKTGFSGKDSEYWVVHIAPRK